jgi:hypothetical protein
MAAQVIRLLVGHDKVNGMKQEHSSRLTFAGISLVLLSLCFGGLFLLIRKSRSVRRWCLMPMFSSAVSMPGKSYNGPFLELTRSEKILRERLEKTVNDLSLTIGDRSIDNYSGMQKAMVYIVESFTKNYYEVEKQWIVINGQPMANIIAEKKGTGDSDKIVVIGAHYDTVPGSPGADDNATGVAAVLELARIFGESDTPYTIRFVAFANEEHPGMDQKTMGSYTYAAGCRERKEEIVAMLSLEMLGCYSEVEGSQHYPEPFNLFYPTKGNFIGFVGNASSKNLVKQVVTEFRRSAQFPSEGVAAPDSIRDVSRSDHWGFWQFGYPALMVTDTSNFRYEHYHSARDTPDRLDFERFTKVVAGLTHVVSELAGRKHS